MKYPRLKVAIDHTSNRRLDTPTFVKMSYPLSQLDIRFTLVMEKLGYAKRHICIKVHPVALAYYLHYGERYVLTLEAMQRLENK